MKRDVSRELDTLLENIERLLAYNYLMECRYKEMRETVRRLKKQVEDK